MSAGRGLRDDWPANATRVLKVIRTDLEADAAEMDGKPVDGKVIAEAFGNLGAAVDALAQLLSDLIERTEGDRK